MGLFGPSNPVFEMLQKDHKKVKDLFEQFEQAEDARTKQRIINEAIDELDVHARLEELLIYPAIRKELDDEEVMDEALEEHHVAHVLLKELKRMRASDDRYEAKFKVLGESIKHHIKEEEGTMFPKAEKVDLDWEELAQKATTRKEALMARKNDGGPRHTARAKRRMHSRGRKGHPRQSRKAA
jgi:hemerythrin-like domain-containing protein